MKLIQEQKENAPNWQNARKRWDERNKDEQEIPMDMAPEFDSTLILISLKEMMNLKIARDGEKKFGYVLFLVSGFQFPAPSLYIGRFRIKMAICVKFNDFYCQELSDK